MSRAGGGVHYPGYDDDMYIAKRKAHPYAERPYRPREPVSQGHRYIEQYEEDSYYEEPVPVKNPKRLRSVGYPGGHVSGRALENNTRLGKSKGNNRDIREYFTNRDYSRSRQQYDELEDDHIVRQLPYTTTEPLDPEESQIISRNKAMRSKAPKNRRSSLSQRGKRLTSIGLSTVAVPHAEVPPQDYHKLLDSDVPDEERMRQLLVWCAKNQLEVTNKLFREKRELIASSANGVKTSGDELNAMNIAKSIEEDLLKDLSSGRIETAWWLRDERPSSLYAGSLKPNAQNQANLELYQKLEKKLQDLKSEKSSWEEQLRNAEKLRNLDRFLVEDALSSAAKEAMSCIPGSYGNLSDKLNDMELALGRIKDQVSRIEAIEKISSKFIDDQQQSLSSTLNKHDKDGPTSGAYSTRDILKALSRSLL